MCGYGPAVVMLTAARKLRGKARAELIRYATSGDISGDRDAVVGICRDSGVSESPQDIKKGDQVRPPLATRYQDSVSGESLR